MSLPINERILREHSSSASFERGVDYYRRGAVVSLERRGQTLMAEVEGSEYEPYRVMISLDEAGVTDAVCTCPYDYGGWCKHVIASLLAYIEEPDIVEEKPDLDTLIAPLSKETLQAALRHVAERHPEILATLELYLALQAPAEGPRERRAVIDPEPIRKQIRYLLRGSYDPDDGYASSPEIGDFLAKADDFIAHGDAESALAILEAVTDECVTAFEDVYGWQYEGEHPFDELDACWAEAILSAQLDEGERERLLAKLPAWREELEDYGVDAFYLVEAALLQGWHDPAVQARLQGEEAEADGGLSDIRLRVLERQGRHEAYLNLAKAAGRRADYLTMLVKLGRAGDALAAYREQLKHPEEALSLARTLREAGKADRALEVAEYGLTLPERLPIDPIEAWDLGMSTWHYELATWTAELAEGLGETSLALKARLEAFKQRPSLADYRQLKVLAGEGWEPLKDELLAMLRGRRLRAFVEARADIFLYEGLLEDAIDAVRHDLSSHGAVIKRVMDAATKSHPDWVIENAKRRAESIMDKGESKHYQHAAMWLGKAKAAYEGSGRGNDWRVYLAMLKGKHARKYKLMEHLRALES